MAVLAYTIAYTIAELERGFLYPVFRSTQAYPSVPQDRLLGMQIVYPLSSRRVEPVTIQEQTLRATRADLLGTK